MLILNLFCVLILVLCSDSLFLNADSQLCFPLRIVLSTVRILCFPLTIVLSNVCILCFPLTIVLSNVCILWFGLAAETRRNTRMGFSLMQNLKSPLLRIWTYRKLSVFEPGVVQNVALHASAAARKSAFPDHSTPPPPSPFLILILFLIWWIGWAQFWYNRQRKTSVI